MLSAKQVHQIIVNEATNIILDRQMQFATTFATDYKKFKSSGLSCDEIKQKMKEKYGGK